MEKINEKDKLKISEKDLKFDNKDIIGSGVFGQVFLAHIIKTNEKVAVKKVFQDRRYKNRELSMEIRCSCEAIGVGRVGHCVSRSQCPNQ